MAVSLLGLAALVSFGVVGGLPLAGAPRDLDPALAAVAPEECMWYFVSAGTTEPDPQSTNETERLLAEPELQHFIAEIEKQLLRAWRRSAGRGREEQVVSRELPKLIKALLTLPFAVFVEDVQGTANGVEAQAALVLRGGEQRAALDGAIASLLALPGDQGPRIATVDQGGETWHRVTIAPGMPEISWGWHEDFFLLVVGERAAESILKRMQGTAPTWLTGVRSEHSVRRESSLGYLNVELVLKRLQPILEQQGAWQYVEKLGLTSLKAVHGIAGFDDEGCVTQSHLLTDGQREGLLSLLPYKPISKRDLRVIPRDAVVAFAVRSDPIELWDDVMRLVSQFEPRAEEEMESQLWAAENELGVHLKDDILAALGDVWIAYLPEGDLMTSWLGSAVAVRVKDASALRGSLEQLAVAAQAQSVQRSRGSVSLRETKVQDHTIHFINVVGEPFPLAPAWCVTDEWFLFGLMPQTVRTLLTREVDESLADVDAVRELIGGSEVPAVISYFDTPRLARSLYPLLQIGAQMLSAQLQREGFDLDVSLLPAAETIVKHLRPAVGTISHASDGFHFNSRHSVPGGGNVVAVAPLMAAGLLPAAQGARHEARKTQEINNLRQLALAFHNYAAARGHFPNNIYSEDGEPLLSWRVQLLPYLEGAAFGDRFHLDEPWDSPHNLKLVQNMPQVFATPGDEALSTAGKTRYVVLAGEETLFPGNEELSFSDVVDGTSNTIMFVRAAQGAAVPWTKPADIRFDADQPLGGIKSGEKDFAVALCDGSCRWLSMSIREESLRALATRAGGEVVELR